MRKQFAVERAEAIVNYSLMMEGCRSRTIQEYFGEKGAVECGVCDLCLARRKRKEPTPHTVTPEEVLAIIAQNDGISPRDLARKFAAEPESIARAVEILFESEKIYTDKGGILRIKR